MGFKSGKTKHENTLMMVQSADGKMQVKLIFKTVKLKKKIEKSKKPVANGCGYYCEPEKVAKETFEFSQGFQEV